MSLNILDKSILKTLKYRAIFSYPLTAIELYEFLITDELKKTVAKANFEKSLNKLISEGLIQRKDGYFYPSGGDFSFYIHQRKKREMYSRDKYRYINELLKGISKNKYIKFIGVTGSVAAGNAPDGDDIDLFIVCEENSVWICRFLVFLYLKLRFKLGKVCPNIFVSVANLSWKDKNVYTAHEVLLLKPVFNKDKTYEKFIQKNIWAFDYFANYPFEKIRMDYHIRKGAKKDDVSSRSLKFVNELLMNLQLMYMKRGRVMGEFRPDFIHFKKMDHQKQILDSYHSPR